MTRKPEIARAEATGSLEDAEVDVREVVFDGAPVRTRFYERSRLPAGASFDGPAVVEQYDSTTVVPPGARVVVDDHANLVVEVG